MKKTYFLLGIVSSLSFAPFYIFPLLMISLAKLYNLIKYSNINITKKLLLSYLFGFGFYLGSIHWIYKSFIVADIYTVAMPFLILLLAAFLGIFILIESFLFQKFKLKNPITFAVSGLISELILSHIFGGFPWALYGYSFAFSIYSLQLAHITYIYGLSFIVLFISGLIAEYVFHKNAKYLIYAFTIFFINITYGIARIHLSDDEKNNFNITIVQPNINIVHNSKNQCQSSLHELILLSKNINSKIIIWPECAIQAIIRENSYILKLIASNILKKNQFLISGCTFFENNKLYNSLIVIDSTGNITSRYDKIHLVPFGEFIPFINTKIFRSIANGYQNYSAGKKTKILNVDNTYAFYPIICYDAIFPFKSTNEDAILNVSNDMWFEGTAGQYQHLEITRVRAIENGQPLIRVTNTGISAVFDKYGREIKKSSTNRKEVINLYDHS